MPDTSRGCRPPCPARPLLSSLSGVGGGTPAAAVTAGHVGSAWVQQGVHRGSSHSSCSQSCGGVGPREPLGRGTLEVRGAPQPCRGSWLPSPQAQNPSWEAESPKHPEYLLSGQNGWRQEHLGVYEVEGEHGGTTGQPGSWWRERQCGGCLARRGVASSPRRVLRRAPDSPGGPLSARGWGQIYNQAATS